MITNMLLCILAVLVVFVLLSILAVANAIKDGIEIVANDARILRSRYERNTHKFSELIESVSRIEVNVKEYIRVDRSRRPSEYRG